MESLKKKKTTKAKKPPFDPFQTHGVLADVFSERVRQHQKFGRQSHPDGTSVYNKSLAERVRAACDEATRDGSLTWRHILAEEYFEAVSEKSLRQLRAELVQVAAVAVAWIEDIDRRAK